MVTCMCLLLILLLICHEVFKMSDRGGIYIYSYNESCTDTSIIQASNPRQGLPCVRIAGLYLYMYASSLESSLKRSM